MADRAQQILDTAPRVVRSLTEPTYWRPAGLDKNPAEGVVIAKADFAWLIEKARRVEGAEAEARELRESFDERVGSVVGRAMRRARTAEAKVRATNTFLIDFGTFGQNDQAIWEYLNHGTPLPMKEGDDG